MYFNKFHYGFLILSICTQYTQANKYLSNFLYYLMRIKENVSAFLGGSRVVGRCIWAANADDDHVIKNEQYLF